MVINLLKKYGDFKVSKMGIDFVSELKKGAIGFALYLAIYGIVWFFGLVWWQLFLFILAITAALNVGMWSWSNFLKSSIITFVFMSLALYLGKWGVIGDISLTVLYLVYFFYTKWNLYIQAIETVEERMYGKSLTQMKKDGEEPPKLKFIWRK